MLAITIFEDTTQIVVGKKIKNKLEIKSLISYKSIYEAYINKDVNSLTMYFDVIGLNLSKTFIISYFIYINHKRAQPQI